VLGCVTQCLQSAALSVLTGPADWVCHIGTLTAFEPYLKDQLASFSALTLLV